MSEVSDTQALEKLRDAHQRLRKEVGKIIIGQETVLDQLLISIFCRSHALLMGVPGLAKTLMVSTLAQSLDMTFKRIQFTPDLMPSDITGTEVIQDDPVTKQRVFKFVPGPIFSHIVLADEINRTPPKTQSALLEAMQEHRVTVQGKTYTLEEPFFVFATQNPIELEGTYPLPEAQLDRFMFDIVIDYLPMAEEMQVVASTTATQALHFERALSAAEIVAFQALVRRVPVAEEVIRYAVELARASRPSAPN